MFSVVAPWSFAMFSPAFFAEADDGGQAPRPAFS